MQETTNNDDAQPDDFEWQDKEEVHILSFAELLEVREDLSEVNNQLDTAAGYWAQVSVILKEQVEAAEQQGETEKAAALSETAEKARNVSERIDCGEAVLELEEAMEDHD